MKLMERERRGIRKKNEDLGNIIIDENEETRNHGVQK